MERKCWVLGHSKQKGACYYACSFCSFAKKKFVLHSPLKEPKGQTHKKVTSMLASQLVSQLACLVFLLICEVSSMFVLAIFRSQKDNKHSCAILLFLIFLGTKWNNKKLSCTLCLQNFLGSKQNYKNCVVYTWVLAFSGTKWDNKNLSHLLVFFGGVGRKYQLRSLSSSDEGLDSKQRDQE